MEQKVELVSGVPFPGKNAKQKTLFTLQGTAGNYRGLTACKTLVYPCAATRSLLLCSLLSALR